MLLASAYALLAGVWSIRCRRGDLGRRRGAALPTGPGVTAAETLKLTALDVPLGLDSFGVALALGIAAS